MDLMDYFWGEDTNHAGGGAQDEWLDSPDRIAQMQAEAQAQAQGTLAPGWNTNRSIADTGEFVDDLIQRVTGHGYSKTPEEMSWSRQKLAPIMEGLDNLTLGQGSKIPAGLAALVQSAGDGFSVENLKGHYNQNRGMQQQALQEWEASIPNLTGGSIIPALRGVETVAGAIGSPVLGAVLNKVPGYAGLAGRGLTGKVAQGAIPLGLIAALDKYSPGLSSNLGLGSSAPAVSQEPYGPNQDSPMKEKAMFRDGQGEWRNALDSRIGKSFSKGAPGSSGLASERYRKTLEPNREDQFRQLYSQTYQSAIKALSPILENISDPTARKTAMDQIDAAARKQALSALPQGERANYDLSEQAPADDKKGAEDEPNTDGEGMGYLGGGALLLAGGAGLAYLSKKSGIPISVLKKIPGIGKMFAGGAKAVAKEAASGTIRAAAGQAGKFVKGGGPLPPVRVADLASLANKGVNGVIPKGGATGLNALNQPQMELLAKIRNMQSLTSKPKIPDNKVDVADIFQRLLDKGVLP